MQNIFYQGNKRKQVPSNHDQAKLQSFFNCAATLMTDQIQNLAFDSISDYTDLLCQPPVRTSSASQQPGSCCFPKCGSLRGNSFSEDKANMQPWLDGHKSTEMIVLCGKPKYKLTSGRKLLKCNVSRLNVA